MTDTTLLVIAKEPRPGRVKTRLCPPCTPDEAATIARAALAATLETARSTPGVHPVLVLDGRPGPWLPPGIPVVPQSRGTLADRLGAAFAGASGPTLLLGMDTPQVTPGDVRATRDALLAPGVDATLGLTADGGWWTVGLRDPQVPAFAGVPMSTPATGCAQLARLRALGLRTRLVGSAVDVDTMADAIVVARAMPDSPFARAVAAVEPRAAGPRAVDPAA